MHPDHSCSDQPSRLARLPFFYGWVILAVAGLAVFVSAPGQAYAIAVFVDPMITDLGWSRTMFSGLYAASSLTGAAAMVLVGRLLDRYGARIMLTAIAILCGFASVGTSLVNHPAHLYIAFFILCLLAQGALVLISTTMVSMWFVRFRGRATAVSSLGVALGLVVFPPLIHWLISYFGDWRQAWVVLGFIIWGALLLPALLLVRRSPESVGLLPDGDPVRWAEGSGAGAVGVPRGSDWSLDEALRARSFWLLLVAVCLPLLVMTGMVFHNASLLGSRGLDASIAAVVLSTLGPTLLVGNIVAGYLVDRFPDRFVIVITHVLLALSIVLALTISQSWQAFIYGGILGLSGGFFMTTSVVVWANYYGRRFLGSIRGVVTMGTVSFTALGPLPFGFLFELTDTYTFSLFLFFALLVISAISAFFACPPQRQRVSSV